MTPNTSSDQSTETVQNPEKEQSTETVQNEQQETKAIEDEAAPTSDKPQSQLPVLPIAGAVIIIIAAVVAAIKTGIFAKLLAIIGITR